MIFKCCSGTVLSPSTTYRPLRKISILYLYCTLLKSFSNSFFIHFSHSGVYTIIFIFYILRKCLLCNFWKVLCLFFYWIDSVCVYTISQYEFYVIYIHICNGISAISLYLNCTLSHLLFHYFLNCICLGQVF